MAEFGTTRVERPRRDAQGRRDHWTSSTPSRRVAGRAGAGRDGARARPADIRCGRRAHVDPEMIQGIKAVSIPVMAKCRIGHFAERRSCRRSRSTTSTSQVLTPATSHIPSTSGSSPSRSCAARRISAGAAASQGAAHRTKASGTGDVVNAVTHMRAVFRHIRRLTTLAEGALHGRNLQARTTSSGGSPRTEAAVVVHRGRHRAPADATLCMQLGADGVFVGSGI